MKCLKISNLARRVREKAGKGGKAAKLTFSLKEIVTDRSPDKNPVLISGDTIFVP